ncbi:subtilisin family serine protease [Fontibacillus solani]|uniref:Subtilisin family serine protease n=1 Tax=Fontibacillus solani TaxID=1572857 RepID=A0A7W3SQX8_9BACL|nr:S8 family serine peptidase [Fontibacillus solani]MBA9084616.1 subtilisin family serine protease [Fontibacillus solani]
MKKLFVFLLSFSLIITCFNIPDNYVNAYNNDDYYNNELTGDFGYIDQNNDIFPYSNTSVTDDVYLEKPLGRFLIKLKKDYAVGDMNIEDAISKDIDPTTNTLSINRSSINLLNNESDFNNSIPDMGDILEQRNIKTIESVNTIYLELTTTEVNNLLNNPIVDSIEEDKIIEIADITPTEVETQPIKDQAQTIPWGIHSIGSYMTQTKKGTGAGSIKVAVFDTGISNHADINIAGGVSFVDTSNTYLDDKGHGTHIAGTIGALNNEIGVIGSAPSAELYAVKVADSNGEGYISSVIQGIEWAINNEINIINMSFVTSQYSEVLHEAIQEATSNGIIVIAAAGNQGTGDNTVLFPAKYPEVIAVGAVDQSHHRTYFSSIGEELDLVAPGFGIVSTTKDGDYGVSSGTSNAAAYVTGAAALLWSHNPSWTYEDVINRLYNTTTSLGNAHEYGKGLVNVAKALNVITGSIAPLSNENLSGLNSVIPTTPGAEFEIASYDLKNNGATIQPGDSITVSLKLEGDQNGNNPHEQIIVEVTSASNPNSIIASNVIQNPQLDVAVPYIWSTSSSTPTGTYYIKYRYPAYPLGNYDDTFVIYVAQSGAGPDTFEPNDTVYTAKVVEPDNSYISYISSSSDIDYYKLNANSSGEISIDLNIPADVDYELSVYDESGIQIGSSSGGTGEDEHIDLQVIENKNYYIKVIGFSGQFSSVPYTLTLSTIQAQPYPAPSGLEVVSFSNSIKLSWDDTPEALSYKLQINGQPVGNTSETTYTFTNLTSSQGYTLGVAAVYTDGTSRYSTIQASTTIPELILHVPQDIEQVSGSSQLFSFRPASTGVYRFYTNSFGGSGAEVDTQLGIFSDMQLSKQMMSNDDANDSVFSEIMISLVGGETYYIQVKGYDSTPLRARITADVVSSTIPYIHLDQPVDINEQSKNSNVYVFIPNENGKYRFTTSKYKGISSSKLNDTSISVFSGPEMDTPISNGYNDDISNSSYSEVVVDLSAGTPYYIRVNEVNGGKVYARLLVTSAGQTSFTSLNLGVPIDLLKSSGEYAYLQFTPLSTGKYRFFTTNYGGESQLNDTEIALYSDSALSQLIDMNDDAKGYKPYGELFSKLEVQLTAGTTYYLTVHSTGSWESLRSRLIVENIGQVNASSAQSIPFDELIETDMNGNPLSISSLYDVDYYKIELTQPEQISLFLSDGKGVIEDVNGNIRGYFSLDGNKSFELDAGIYYLRIENDALHTNRKVSPWGFTGFIYELTVNINIIEYVSDNSNARSIYSRMIDPSEYDLSLDATPGSGNQAKVKYKLTRNTSKIYVEVFTSYGNRSVYKKEITGTFNKNQILDITWNGTVNPHSVDKYYFAHSYEEVYPGGYLYYAKNGNYKINVYHMNAKNKKTNIQEYEVTVNNDPLNKMNIVPLPPDTINGRLITPDDMDFCEKCVDYFNKYVLGPGDFESSAMYSVWFEEIYGQTEYRKFWTNVDDLATCDNGSTLDQLQCTADTIGMIPVIGEFVDGANAVVYLFRGKYVDALLSTGAVVPIVGSFITGGKKVTYTGVTAFKRIYKANPCGCLPEGTSITTLEGTKPIEDIKIGDLVLAKDVDSGIQAYKPVERLYNGQAEHIYTLSMGNTTIETTGNHPFWVKGKGWVPAEELIVGDQLEADNGELHAIDSIKLSNELRQVYNFTVSDFHTYYISDLSILTHNLMDVCQIINYKNVTGSLISGKKGKNSVILTAEITKATKMEKPAGWDAHHIVAAESQNEYAKKARDILEGLEIDRNSSANGVYLPKETGVSTTNIDGQTMATHNGGHAKSYYLFVYEQIEPVKNNRDEVLKKLDFIRKELMEGRLEIGNIAKR